jgi:hypothetical protein
MQLEVDYTFHNVSEFFGWLKKSLNNSNNIDG